MRNIASISIFCLILFSQSAFAFLLPREKRVPGGVAHVPLFISNGKEPRVLFGKKRVMVKKYEDTWIAIVGLPLDLKPGRHSLMMVSPKRHRYYFYVRAKRYGKKNIKISDRNKIILTKKNIARAKREEKIIERITKTFTKNRDLPRPLSAPVKGKVSSRFGVLRYYNGNKGKPHGGIDIANRIGTPVRSPDDATVLATGHYLFLGKTVFLDHGHGLITLYAHLNSIQVERGRHVVPRQVIGTLGTTGRTTGPHLHWAVILNEARINPKLMMRSRR